MKIDGTGNGAAQTSVQSNSVAGTSADRHPAGKTEGKGGADKQTAKGDMTLRASDLNLNQEETVDARIKARKEAMKQILEVFGSQTSVDEDLEERRQHIGQVWEDLEEQNEISQKKTDNDMEALLNQYGVDKDSTEYTDVQLKMKQKLGKDPLTEDEKERLKFMGEMTDFQKAAYTLMSASEQSKQLRADDAQLKIENEVRAITGIKIELLKSEPMVEAQNQAKEMMADANKEFIGELMADVKESIDKQEQERVEAAEKKKQEAEEEKARIEAAKADKDKDRKDEELDLFEDTDILSSTTLQKADSLQKKLETEVKMMLLKQQITTEDVKGIQVDEQK